jgi:hypothetical protein
MKNKNEKSRFGISVDPLLVKDFDRAWQSGAIPATNRSMAIELAMRELLSTVKFGKRNLLLFSTLLEGLDANRPPKGPIEGI